MYQGNYDSRDKKTSSRDKGTARFRWRKEFVLLVSVFVMIAGVVGGTIAYLTSQSGAITNTFDMATVDCEIQGSGAQYTVKNISNIDAHIRAAVFVTWQDENGNIYGQTNTGFAVSAGDGWQSGRDGYYYSQNTVKAGQTVPGDLYVNTSDLEQSIEDEKGKTYNLKVEVIAEAIQSEPTKAIQEAWGYTPSNNQ